MMTPDTIELACIISFTIGAIAGYLFRFIGTVPLKQYEKDIDFLIDGYENICNGYKSLNDDLVKRCSELRKQIDFRDVNASYDKAKKD